MIVKICNSPSFHSKLWYTKSCFNLPIYELQHLIHILHINVCVLHVNRHIQKQEVKPECCSPSSIYLVFLKGTLSGLGLANYVRLPDMDLHRFTYRWFCSTEISNPCHHAQLLMWVLGIELKFSCYTVELPPELLLLAF